MFKLESYITPILLSYVDKYIKNFRPEDSQVSLWGGDATFHNLDLRLEVLEQELQLPFSFVSGHIHELTIHVPWTKLASEPIHITINTIECTLKLRGADSSGSDAASSHASSTGTSASKEARKKTPKKQEDLVAPPGYIQTLVNKIVSNITIVCNNLILKYVEEDIVLSVNVKTVTLQSANAKWEAKFTELSAPQTMIRKLVNLVDLTVCLDKRNSSGKIELYQEPLLYRCSMEIHMLRMYHSATAKRASSTRADLKCSRMDFSLSEQQIPMLMRLVNLALALHAKELRPDPSTTTVNTDDTIDRVTDDSEDNDNDASWAGWAWSWVPSLVPVDWDSDWTIEQQAAYTGHTCHTGVYIAQASISLKVTEQTSERSYYGPKKVKFVPFMILHLKGSTFDMVTHGTGWFNMQVGVSHATLQPYSDCFCGVKEACLDCDKPENPETFYFSVGMDQENYLSDSLFDPSSVENRGSRKQYTISWDYHQGNVTESSLLDRTPAFAMDYLYQVDLPDDFASESLSELGSDLEYSNLSERTLCRIVVGQTLVIRYCSGLIHRIQMIQHAAKQYDYSPYSTPKPEITLEELPPASLDDFEALNENIPTVKFQVTFFHPTIHIHLNNHPNFDPALYQAQHRKRRVYEYCTSRKTSTAILPGHLPVFSIDCKCLDSSMTRPMYPRRLITTTCKLPAPPPTMFQACHNHTNIKLFEFSAQLILSPKSKPTTILMPSTFTHKRQTLLMPQYWSNRDLFHDECVMQAEESVTITLTNPRMLVISYILQSLTEPGAGLEVIRTTSLLKDAAKDAGIEFLEVCAEAIGYHQVSTPITQCHSMTLKSVRAFVLDTDADVMNAQALVVSGPDVAAMPQPEGKDGEPEPLLSLTMQRPLDPANQAHPPLLICHLRELRACVDPLLWRWLHYCPAVLPGQPDVCPANLVATTMLKDTPGIRARSASTEKRPAPAESVHSSSDHHGPSQGGRTRSDKRETITVGTNTSEKMLHAVESGKSIFDRDHLLRWFPVWRGLVICGEIAHCVVYLPTSSLSAVGVRTIQEAIARYDQDVLVVKFPHVTLRSAAQRLGLYCYAVRLPVVLPDDIWTATKISFPWTLSFVDASCYTIQSGNRLHFLKPVSANATISISTKYHPAEHPDKQPADLVALNLCVYVDTTPVKVALSEKQIMLMSSVLVGLVEVASALSFYSPPPPTAVSTEPARATSPTSPTTFQESSMSRDTPSNYRIVRSRTGDIESQTGTDSIVNLTALMQWTLARLTVTLYAEEVEPDEPRQPSEARNELKLQFDLDDIMTSLELQDVFMKLKCKVASANIQHYRRTSPTARWLPGSYLGLVMRGNDEAAHDDGAEESSGLASVLFTRARCKNVHNKWGATQNRKQRRTSFPAQTHPDSAHQTQPVNFQTNPGSQYISEIVIKIQAVDFILSPNTLAQFAAVLSPLSNQPPRRHLRLHRPKDSWALGINNHTLPLLYVETKTVRFILPASELTDLRKADDACLIQLDAISLAPQADNPLGRVVIRADLYAMAERSRTLTVPGADVEDRQYQLNVSGFSINTGTWHALERCLAKNLDTNELKTMSENPAVKWNSLVRGGESITPHITLTPVIARIELCIIAAPAIVDRNHVLVCGHSFELNALTDIEVTISTSQLLLGSILSTEIISLCQPLVSSSTEVSHQEAMNTFSSEQLVSLTEYRNSKESGLNLDSVSMASPARNVAMSPENVSIPERSSGYHEGEDSGSNVFTRNTFMPIQETVVESTERTDTIPVEILLTAGSITLVFYEVAEAILLETRDEYKPELIKEDVDKGKKGKTKAQPKKQQSVKEVVEVDKKPKIRTHPLIYVLLAQPHLFLSNLANEYKVQMSCFDFGVRTATTDKFIDGQEIPSLADFTDVLLETKNGDPHPDTGIPPSFVTLKLIQTARKSAKVEIEIGRPAKLNFSLSRYAYIQTVMEKVLASLVQNSIKDPFSSPRKCDTQSVNAHPAIRVLPRSRKSMGIYDHGTIGTIIHEEQENESSIVSGDCGSEGIQADYIGASTITNANRPEERHKGLIFANVSAISVTTQQMVLDVESSNNIQLGLSFSGVSCSVTNIPGRDRVVGNISLNCLTLVTRSNNATRLLINPWSCTAHLCLVWEPWLVAAPRIQFTADSDCFMVDVGPERLRCLHDVWTEYKTVVDRVTKKSTKVKEAERTISEEKLIEPQVGDLEQHYRDDLRAGAFQFVDASGSREDLPLPYQVMFWQDPPTMAWRYPQPRTLTRVDVFPVPFKVANLKTNTEHQKVFCWLQYWSEVLSRFQPYAQFTLSESEVLRLELPGDTVACTWRVQLALTGEDDDDATSARLTINPKTLAACMRVDSFFSPKLIPIIQAALNVSSVQVVGYNHVKGVRPMPAPLEHYTFDGLVPEIQNVITAQLDNASLYFSMWTEGKQVINLSSHFRLDTVDYAFLTQQCIVEPFRGQLTVCIDEKVDISCVTKPITIRFSTAAAHTLAISAQLWSQALREFVAERNLRRNSIRKSPKEFQVVLSRYVICNDTVKSLRFGQFLTDEDILLQPSHCHFYAWRTQKAGQLMRVSIEGSWVWSDPFAIDVDGIRSLPLKGCGDFSLIVRVASLSATQKRITISGQLTITNILIERFECRVMEPDEEPDDSQLFTIEGNTTSSTILLDNSKKTVIRIRFHSLEGAGWSGDIPLRVNTKTGTPWLVKIPLQERSYICIWCHIISGPCGSILAALYPLYSIRSLLPVPAQLSIDTPGLQSNIRSDIKGSGIEQQLYCPGTIDHSHKLTFQLEAAPPTPSVPLSYSMLERRKNGMGEVEGMDIDDIVKALKEPMEPTFWPFAGEDYAGIDWIAPQQPETDIHVRYEPRGPYCATLQVQIQPWALFLNTLGFPIDLVIDEHLACRIPHQGVLTPPRLEGTFHLGINAIDTPHALYKSPSLQLHKPGSSFYMPRIAGFIPVTGETQIAVLCGYTVAFACVSSSLVPNNGEMRVVHIKPSYVMTSRVNKTLRIACMALHDTDITRSVPEPQSNLVEAITASDSSGHPLVHWSILDDGETELVPYIMLSTGGNWSQPLEVDNKRVRRTFSIPTQSCSDEAYVLTSQEHNGQIYLAIYPETQPHIVIDNHCQFSLLIAEGDPETFEPMPETPHLDWHCRIDANCSAYYCLPSMLDRFPGVVPMSKTINVVLSLADSPTEDRKNHWSTGISIAEPQEQFVRLPCHGDVKVRVETICMTIHLTIETVSHVEISARDIRSRLTQQHISKLAARVSIVQTDSPISDSTDVVMKKSVVSLDSRSIDIPISASPSATDVSIWTLSSIGTNRSLLPPSDITQLGWSILSGPSEESDTVSFESAKNFFDGSTMHVGYLSATSLERMAQNIDSNEFSARESEELSNVSKTLISLNCFMKGFNLTLIENINGAGSERTEVSTLSLDNICLSLEPLIIPDKVSDLVLTFSVGDIQLDNQMYQRGGFDFPVVVISQTPNRYLPGGFSLGIPARKLIEQAISSPIIRALIVFERSTKAAKNVTLSVGPIAAYLEDTFLMKLSESMLCFLPNALVIYPIQLPPSTSKLGVPIPMAVYWNSYETAYPVRLSSLSIDPINILLSVHASAKLYLALDRSPLTFGGFVRRDLETTPYRLGLALTMHYVSGALLGAGWVVGSLELLGSPGGLARTLGSGIKDFVSLPYRGILEGPWGFFSGVTYGSVSLLRHCAAGAVGSVTGLASSVARNLDRLTLDNEHLQRTEELRRMRPQGLRQGISQGLSGFGISLLGAVGGIAHHPMQAAMAGSVSTKDVALGVGRGIVGAITKPLSGAAELVASTGRGLLNSTGWDMQPNPRSQPIIEHAFTGVNSKLKYGWKLSTGSGLLHVAEASCGTQSGSYEAVALVLTTRALFLIDTDKDTTRRVLSLAELTGMDNPSDPTLLCFTLAQPLESDADAASRARVEDFVRHSSGLIHDGILPELVDSSQSSSPVQSVNPIDAPLMFYVNPQARNYFLTILELAKRQSRGRGFSVL